MTDPLTMSTCCPPDSPEVVPVLRCAGRWFSEIAPQTNMAATVAAFIRRRFLQAYGAEPNLRIPSLLALTTAQGSLMAEVVCVPVPVFFSKSQTEHLIQRAGLDALLFSAEADQAEAIGQGVWLLHLPVSAGAAWMPEHTAKITFTSGSTGTPKGACLSAQQMAATACALQQLTEVYPDIDGVIHCAGSWRIPRCRWCTWPPGRPPQPLTRSR